MAYVVIAGGLVAKIQSDTGEGYFYRGDILPKGVPAEELERLEGMGLIAPEKGIEVELNSTEKPAAKK